LIRQVVQSMTDGPVARVCHSVPCGRLALWRSDTAHRFRRPISLCCKKMRMQRNWHDLRQ